MVMYSVQVTQLTAEQVRHIAKLARLRLTDEEAGKMAKELTSILKYVDMLTEVDTSKVKPTAQVIGLQNVLRDDVVRTNSTPPDDLLGCSPLPIVDHQISSPSAHGN